jgi:hypothetical protein
MGVLTGPERRGLAGHPSLDFCHLSEQVKLRTQIDRVRLR